MAGPQQQPPYLHLAELTATQFLEIWKHFDADGGNASVLVTLHEESIPKIIISLVVEKGRSRCLESGKLGLKEAPLFSQYHMAK